jgi:predicted ArsR family transcriptional regulator
MKGEWGADGLRKRLGALGTAVARQLRVQHPGPKNRRQKIAKLAEVMEQLGYNATATAGTIQADNCVFHHLAQKNPEVCQFDLALLSSFTDSKVDHVECMARGGNVCRFKFTAK